MGRMVGLIHVVVLEEAGTLCRRLYNGLMDGQGG